MTRVNHLTALQDRRWIKGIYIEKCLTSLFSIVVQPQDHYLLSRNAIAREKAKSKRINRQIIISNISGGRKECSFAQMRSSSKGDVMLPCLRRLVICFCPLQVTPFLPCLPSHQIYQLSAIILCSWSALVGLLFWSRFGKILAAQREQRLLAAMKVVLWLLGN